MKETKQISNAGRWARFLVGLALTLAFITLLASGKTLPGISGIVVNHNQDADIQATALIYMDLDAMQDLEEYLEQMKDTAE